MIVKLEWPIELADGTEVMYDIEVEITPSTPDVPYLKNGDPGYPGDPGSTEIVSVKLQGLAGGPGIEIKECIWRAIGLDAHQIGRIFEKAGEMTEPDTDDPAGWEPKNVYQQDDPHDD